MVALEFKQARLIRNPENVGFGCANNIGMTAAIGDFFLLLNSDAHLDDDSVARLLQRLRNREDVGVAGPLIRHEEGTLQASAYRFGSLRLLALEELGLYKLLPRETRSDLFLGGYWDHSVEREVDWVLGACMLVRRRAFQVTEGFDPSIFLYGEEEEWCRRIREAGFKVLFSPAAHVTHVGRASSHQLLGRRGRLDRCLAAADDLLVRQEGVRAQALAPPIRIVGALIKLVFFAARRVVKDDAQGREALWTAGVVLGHYFRRATRP
jgi:hypothetical protein